MAEYEIPEELHYTNEDEWARLEDHRLTVGITDFAQQQLGDIVFVELPEVDTAVPKGSPFGVVESVKAVSDLYAPLSGRVVAVNAELADRPEALNEDCYGAGWLLVIEVDAPGDFQSLLDAAAYRKHIVERSKE